MDCTVLVPYVDYSYVELFVIGLIIAMGMLTTAYLLSKLDFTCVSYQDAETSIDCTYTHNQDPENGAAGGVMLSSCTKLRDRKTVGLQTVLSHHNRPGIASSGYNTTKNGFQMYFPPGYSQTSETRDRSAQTYFMTKETDAGHDRVCEWQTAEAAAMTTVSDSNDNLQRHNEEIPDRMYSEKHQPAISTSNRNEQTHDYLLYEQGQKNNGKSQIVVKNIHECETVLSVDMIDTSVSGFSDLVTHSHYHKISSGDDQKRDISIQCHLSSEPEPQIPSPRFRELSTTEMTFPVHQNHFNDALSELVLDQKSYSTHAPPHCSQDSNTDTHFDAVRSIRTVNDEGECAHSGMEYKESISKETLHVVLDQQAKYETDVEIENTTDSKSRTALDKCSTSYRVPSSTKTEDPFSEDSHPYYHGKNTTASIHGYNSTIPCPSYSDGKEGANNQMLKYNAGTDNTCLSANVCTYENSSQDSQNDICDQLSNSVPFNKDQLSAVNSIGFNTGENTEQPAQPVHLKPNTPPRYPYVGQSACEFDGVQRCENLHSSPGNEEQSLEDSHLCSHSKNTTASINTYGKGPTVPCSTYLDGKDCSDNNLHKYTSEDSNCVASAFTYEKSHHDYQNDTFPYEYISESVHFRRDLSSAVDNIKYNTGENTESALQPVQPKLNTSPPPKYPYLGQGTCEYKEGLQTHDDLEQRTYITKTEQSMVSEAGKNIIAGDTERCEHFLAYPHSQSFVLKSKPRPGTQSVDFVTENKHVTSENITHEIVGTKPGNEQNSYISDTKKQDDSLEPEALLKYNQHLHVEINQKDTDAESNACDHDDNYDSAYSTSKNTFVLCSGVAGHGINTDKTCTMGGFLKEQQKDLATSEEDEDVFHPCCDGKLWDDMSGCPSHDLKLGQKDYRNETDGNQNSYSMKIDTEIPTSCSDHKYQTRLSAQSEAQQVKCKNKLYTNMDSTQNNYLPDDMPSTQVKEKATPNTCTSEGIMKSTSISYVMKGRDGQFMTRNNVRSPEDGKEANLNQMTQDRNDDFERTVQNIIDNVRQSSCASSKSPSYDIKKSCENQNLDRDQLEPHGPNFSNLHSHKNNSYLAYPSQDRHSSVSSSSYHVSSASTVTTTSYKDHFSTFSSFPMRTAYTYNSNSYSSEPRLYNSTHSISSVNQSTRGSLTEGLAPRRVQFPGSNQVNESGYQSEGKDEYHMGSNQIRGESWLGRWKNNYHKVHFDHHLKYLTGKSTLRNVLDHNGSLQSLSRSYSADGEAGVSRACTGTSGSVSDSAIQEAKAFMLSEDEGPDRDDVDHLHKEMKTQKLNTEPNPAIIDYKGLQLNSLTEDPPIPLPPESVLNLHRRYTGRFFQERYDQRYLCSDSEASGYCDLSPKFATLHAKDPQEGRTHQVLNNTQKVTHVRSVSSKTSQETLGQETSECDWDKEYSDDSVDGGFQKEDMIKGGYTSVTQEHKEKKFGSDSRLQHNGDIEICICKICKGMAKVGYSSRVLQHRDSVAYEDSVIQTSSKQNLSLAGNSTILSKMKMKKGQFTPEKFSTPPLPDEHFSLEEDGSLEKTSSRKPFSDSGTGTRSRLSSAHSRSRPVISQTRKHFKKEEKANVTELKSAPDNGTLHIDLKLHLCLSGANAQLKQDRKDMTTHTLHVPITMEMPSIAASQGKFARKRSRKSRRLPPLPDGAYHVGGLYKP